MSEHAASAPPVEVAWVAKLKGHLFDMEDLEHWTHDNYIHVKKVDKEQYALVLPFTVAGRDHKEANKRAQAHLTSLNGALTLLEYGYRPVELAGGMSTLDAQGVQRGVYLEVHGAESRSKCGRVSLAVNGVTQSDPTLGAAGKICELAERSGAVRDALLLVGKSQPLWSELYIAMELVKAILQATPIIVILGATTFFGETVGWRRWCSIVVGLIGVVIILRPAAGDFSALSLLAVVGTLGFAGRDLASRAAPASLTTWLLGFYGFLTVVVAGTLFSLWDGKMFVWPTVANFMGLLAAVGVGVFAYTALMKAMRTGSITSVTPFRYTRLVFGITLGIVMFGERLDGPMILGCLVVIGSGLFIWWQGTVSTKTYLSVSIEQDSIV